MTPQQYCQDKALQKGSCLHYSLRFLPGAQRQALTVLYAFFREIKEIGYKCQDTSIAHTKLQWWLGEITQTFTGTPSHPVSRALLKVIQDYRLPSHYFEEIIEGFQQHLEISQYATLAELEAYCKSTSSVLSLLSTQVLGYQNDSTLKYAEQLGIALQLTHWLRQIRQEAQRGKIYIPQEDLVRFQVDRAALLNGQGSEMMQPLFAYQATRIGAYYHEALKYLSPADRFKQRSGLIRAQLALATLKEIENDGYQLFHHYVRLPPLRKLWITWHTLWQARQG